MLNLIAIRNTNGACGLYGKPTEKPGVDNGITENTFS